MQRNVSLLTKVRSNSAPVPFRPELFSFVEKDSCKIDLVICLGGDGTLLHVSSIFQKSCPPVLSFAMGSLGFLTPFDFTSHEKILDEVLSDNVAVLLRTRLNCTIVKDGAEKNVSSETPLLSTANDDKAQMNGKDPAEKTSDISHLALNEVVIDRGPNSYLSNLDFYINDQFITKVQGDGEWQIDRYRTTQQWRNLSYLMQDVAILLSWASPIDLSIRCRFNHLHSDGVDSVCHGWWASLLSWVRYEALFSSWCFNGASECSCDGDLSDLSTFIIISSDCCSSWYRTESESIRRYSSDCLAFRGRKKSIRIGSDKQVRALLRREVRPCWTESSSVYASPPVSIRCRSSVESIS